MAAKVPSRFRPPAKDTRSAGLPSQLIPQIEVCSGALCLSRSGIRPLYLQHLRLRPRLCPVLDSAGAHPAIFPLTLLSSLFFCLSSSSGVRHFLKSRSLLFQLRVSLQVFSLPRSFKHG
ncbi:hypothetical protein LIA77_02794 [Sarocladium implicatum]|nr:hypothetical protein LIA77_02794 [Sarocladium implicatum]